MGSQNVTFWQEFWEIIEKIANSTGIISSVISVATLFIASSTKNAIKKHDDIKEYKAEIDNHISVLTGYLTTIEVDDIYNEKILTSLYKKMDSLLIHYKYVIKPYRHKINNIKKYADEASKKIAVEPKSRYNKTKLTRLLNQVIEYLKKVKKSI